MLNQLLLQEVHEAALCFKREARWTSPRIISGHKVAHDQADDSRVLNFSTITKVVALSTGGKIFLIYRYPFSWIHSITDNLQRWGSGRPSTKPFLLSTWEKTFAPKSRIEIYPTNVPGVVAMPYIPNYNLHDVLYHGIGRLTDEQILKALSALCDQINNMHRAGNCWGELIVHNIILKKMSLEPIICDTETDYWTSLSFDEQRMHDWRDFIFSVCGSNKTISIDVEALAKRLFGQINDEQAKQLLREFCRKPRTFGQKIFWQGMSGSLSQPSVEVYERIKSALSNA